MEIGFAAQPFDRADHIRRSVELLDQAWAAPQAQCLQMDGLVPLLAQGQLIWAPVPDGLSLQECVFLGLLHGRPSFATIPYGVDPDPAETHSRTWDAIAALDADGQGVLGHVRSLLNWHRLNPCCARCGGKTEVVKGGWQRNCTQCAAEHFPRVDPVVIMLVEHEGSLLLGRQRHYSAGRYSALAGFLEPGETVEDAVAREVFEEAGVRVNGVRYIASQPWPFPAQLMIGCIGMAESRDLVIDHAEIEDARWFNRDEVAEALTQGADNRSFIAPPVQAIAHRMLGWWMEQQT